MTFLALGDSHIRVFEHKYFRRFMPKTRFKIAYVPGATAGGAEALVSKTQSYGIFKNALDAGGYDKIIVTLGEVDAAYAVWQRAKAQNKEVDVVLEESILKYQNFILFLSSYAPVVVISAPHQTIDDCRGCKDETSVVRASITASLKERVCLTLRFNKAVRLFCKKGNIAYFNFDKISLTRKTSVRSWLLNGANPCDHHYLRWAYALLIIVRLHFYEVGYLFESLYKKKERR